MPFPIKRGYQYGSVDHQRSINNGYRKHSNILRIAACARFKSQERGDNYTYATHAFYID